MLRDLLLLHNDGLSQAYPEDEIETGGEQVFVNERTHPCILVSSSRGTFTSRGKIQFRSAANLKKSEYFLTKFFAGDLIRFVVRMFGKFLPVIS